MLCRFFLAALTVGTVRARHVTAYRASRPSILFSTPPDRQNVHRHGERRRLLGGTRPRMAARSVYFHTSSLRLLTHWATPSTR